MADVCARAQRCCHVLADELHRKRDECQAKASDECRAALQWYEAQAELQGVALPSECHLHD
jgi:hypothetical protein